MNIFLSLLLGLLWLFQFSLLGLVFVLIFAWVERRNEVRGIKKTDKIASADEVASVALLTFLGTAGGSAIMAAHVSDLYIYIYASVFGMSAYGGFARWLMARIIKPTTAIVPDAQ